MIGLGRLVKEAHTLHVQHYIMYYCSRATATAALDILTCSHLAKKEEICDCDDGHGMAIAMLERFHMNAHLNSFGRLLCAQDQSLFTFRAIFRKGIISSFSRQTL